MITAITNVESLPGAIDMQSASPHKVKMPETASESWIDNKTAKANNLR
jgi:hypothetical protein